MSERRCLHGSSCCGHEWETHWPDEELHHCHVRADVVHDTHECDCGAVSLAEESEA